MAEKNDANVETAEPTTESNKGKRQIISVYKKSTACDILQSELLDN